MFVCMGTTLEECNVMQELDFYIFVTALNGEKCLWTYNRIVAISKLFTIVHILFIVV